MLTTKYKSEIIENYIKENLMSKASFARKCGISKSTLYKVLRNEGVKLITIFKIGDYMKIKITDWFDDKKTITQ